jgi:hypothetical protein
LFIIKDRWSCEFSWIFNRITLFAQYFSGFYKPIKELYFANNSSVSTSFNSELPYNNDDNNNNINENINDNGNNNNYGNEIHNNNAQSHNNNNKWYKIFYFIFIIYFSLF